MVTTKITHTAQCFPFLGRSLKANIKNYLQVGTKEKPSLKLSVNYKRCYPETFALPNCYPNV